MATADLFDPTFPHGTVNGFDMGCRGSACTYHGDPTWLSCKEAKAAKRSEYSLRNHSDAQRIMRPGAAIPVAESEAAEPAHPKPAPPVTIPPHPTPVPVAPRREETITAYGTKRQPFTEADQARLRELNAQGLSDYAIAKDLGRVQSIVSKWRTKMGLTANGKYAGEAAAPTLQPSTDDSPVPDPEAKPIETPSAAELVTPPAEGTPAPTPPPLPPPGPSAAVAAAAEATALQKAAEAVSDLEGRLADQAAELSRERHTNSELVDQLAETSAALTAERDKQVRTGVLEVAGSTGGDTPTALAEVTSPARVEQLELTVAQTDAGTRVLLAMPSTGTATLQVVDGAVSVMVGAR